MDERDPAEDTRESCWICDRVRGELCFVHARLGDREPMGAQLVWVVGTGAEEAEEFQGG